MILCAGQGTRMRPYTYYIHKSMLPLSDGRPIVHHIIEHCYFNKLKPVICVSENSFHNQLRHVCNEDFSVTPRPMGTAGEVLVASDLYLKGEEDFFVYYGDTITDVDIQKMYEFHKRHGFLATLCGVKGFKCDYGIINGHKKVTSIQEKPMMPNYICTGAFWCNKKILKYLMPDTDFMKDVFPLVLKKGQKLGFWKHRGFYYDVGSISNYDKCLNELK